MRLGIVGKKVGMTQIYDENGVMIPVTVVDTTGCAVSEVRTRDKHGYNALQVAVGERKPQNLKKAIAGHLKKASLANKAKFQEIRLAAEDDLSQFKAGQALSVSMFEKGDRVDVSGITIGKGFQGVMRRHGFHGKPASHGTHKHFRHGGSIGTNTFPGRVLKNRKMPGQMGNVPRTVQNLEVAAVMPEDNLLLLKGGIPGSKNSYVVVRSAKKRTLPGGRSWTGQSAKAEDRPVDQAPEATES